MMHRWNKDDGQMDHQAATSALLQQDALRLRCLQAALSLGLHDWYLGAGFLRNLIWDALHQYPKPTPLNDVDLVYFDNTDLNRSTEQHYVQQLSALVPQVQWEVKNQARMHLFHQHAPYQNCADGISRWVEVPTCVGVRLDHSGHFDFYSSFGLAENWSLSLRINPLYPRPQLFRQRIKDKGWLELWPLLQVVVPG